MYFFFYFFQDQAKIKRSTLTIHPPKPETGTSEVLFVPEYNTWGGGVDQMIHPIKKTWRLEEIK